MDEKLNEQRSSKKKSFSVSEFESLGRKNSKKRTESTSDFAHQSVNNGKARTNSVSDSGTNSKHGSKTKSETSSNPGIKRQGSSKKGSRKSSTNEELPSNMMVMSQRRQQRIEINTNLASKQDEEDDVFIKKEKVLKSENVDR